ncbi:MAG: transposase [Roseburia intestinalis]
MDNRSSSHSMKMPVSYSFYSKVLYGKLREDVREILSTLCKYKDVDIITNAVFVDYVHQIVVLPPKLSISNFKGYLKGKSTLMIYDKCR